jgi:hypothetical protein
LFYRQGICKVKNLWEGEAPAEPKCTPKNTAQQWLRPPLFVFAFHNDFADFLFFIAKFLSFASETCDNPGSDDPA